MAALLVFIIATKESFWPKKNSWTQKVPDLTITLSKIGLKIHIRKFLNI